MLESSKPVERVLRLWLVSVIVVAILVSTALLVFVPGDWGRRAVFYTIAGLAILGLSGALMYAAGLLRFMGRSGSFDLACAIAGTNEDAYVVTSPHSHVLFVNEAYLKLTGLTLRAAQSVECVFARAPEASEAIYRLAQAARSGRSASEEVRLANPLAGEGGAVWYRIFVRPLGRAALWTLRDITRERDVHETFFKNLQHAIDYLDRAPAGFFSADHEGALTYMNATLATWLGYDIAAIVPEQMSLSDIIAADGAALLDVGTGASGEVCTRDVYVDLRRHDGTSKPVRLLHRVQFQQDGRPTPSHTLVLEAETATPATENADITEARFSRMFNATPLPLAYLSVQGGVKRANGAFAKLIPAAMNVNLFQTVVKRDVGKLRAAIVAAGEGKAEVAPVDVAMLHGKEERVVRFFISAAEVRDFVNLIALDMTEQKVLLDNFAQSQKMQAVGQLAGGIAHDFNNVLTAIIGYSDLLLANHRPTDPSFQDIMQIRQNANRAAGLVRQLLAFSRRQTLRPQILQLSDVFSELQMMLRRLVGERIELEVEHGRDLWLVKADLNQFEQVVVNLVVNARDAMSEGGRITLRTRNLSAAECAQFGEKSLIAGEYVVLEVQDTGHGIAPEVLSKIFEPFFTTKEVGKGTGLGLSMVYGIVKQTEGYVFCESAPGQGATFRVLLPRYIPDPTAETEKKEEAKPVTDLTGQGAILLVEDEEAVRAFAARALTSRGYTVLEAESGRDAIKVVEEAGGKIDLIVSDVIMPEMDGPSMLVELRKRGVAAKIIFVSGYADDAFARSLPDETEFQFLQKPFTLKQLIETVKGVMS